VALPASVRPPPRGPYPPAPTSPHGVAMVRVPAPRLPHQPWPPSSGLPKRLGWRHHDSAVEKRMAHQKGQGHLHDVIFSIPGARRSREMSRISRFRCRRVTLSLQALIIRRPFAESSEAMNPRHRMNANRCRRRVITLNARIAAHQQIEYIKRFDRVECRPPGSTLSRGVGTLGLLAAQCLMSTSITCAVVIYAHEQHVYVRMCTWVARDAG
jgi:hypothetical protein